MTPKQITLQAALQDFGLRELPAEYNPELNVPWVTGIALVTKAGGVTEYVRVSNRGDGSPEVKKDYGTPAAVLRYDRLFAVDKLEKRFIPVLRGRTAQLDFLVKNGYSTEEIIALLEKKDKTPEQIEADQNKIRGYINKVALSLAKTVLQEEKRCRNIYKPKDNG